MKKQEPRSVVQTSAEKEGFVGQRVNIYDDEDIRGMPKFRGFTKIFIFCIGVLIGCLSIYEVFLAIFNIPFSDHCICF